MPLGCIEHEPLYLSLTASPWSDCIYQQQSRPGWLTDAERKTSNLPLVSWEEFSTVFVSTMALQGWCGKTFLGVPLPITAAALCCMTMTHRYICNWQTYQPKNPHWGNWVKVPQKTNEQDKWEITTTEGFCCTNRWRLEAANVGVDPSTPVYYNWKLKWISVQLSPQLQQQTEYLWATRASWHCQAGAQVKPDWL